jgi:hypothetical protein
MLACDMYVNCLISCGTVPAAACKSTIQLYYFQVLITDPHCPHPPSCSQYNRLEEVPAAVWLAHDAELYTINLVLAQPQAHLQ